MHTHDGNPNGNLVDKVAVEVSYDGVQKAGASEVASKQHVEPVVQQSSQPASDGYGKDLVDKYATDKNAINDADGKDEVELWQGEGRFDQGNNCQREEK